ncbi:MAG: hypothetical protein J6N15_06490 [Ruminiclostridium sp.]|nr:hypothetical protein [Ruminiclostridium sp.]
MKINVNKEKKRTEVWLTRAEANDAGVKADLAPIYRRYKEMKYMVAVFVSGTYDLMEQTAMLLKCNLK